MLDRRNILKFLLAGAAGSLFTPLPWKLLEDSTVWTQNWPWIPAGTKGAVTFRRTVSKLCPSGAGLLVQLVGGRPIRVLPDPEHPLSLGGISVLAASEVQLMYSPARVRMPLRRGADGVLRPVDASDALRLFIAALEKIQSRNRPDKVMCLCGDETGSLYELLSLLTRGLGSDVFYFMPSELQPHAQAALAAGADGLPVYNLEDSDLIVCLGADMLGTWGTVLRNNGVRAAGRPPGNEKAAGRLIYCGPARNATAVAADKWLPLKPGTEKIFLLGLANLLLKNVAPPEIAVYTPELVSAAAGVDAAALRELARTLGTARRPLVLTGACAGQGGSAALARLEFFFNRLLPGGALSFMAGPETVLAGAAAFTDLARRSLYNYAGAAQGEEIPDLLISYDANPVYSLPASVREQLRLADIPFKVAFSSFLDETALAADLVFPLPLGLERLDDMYTPFGSGRIIYNICPQIVKPAHSAPPPAEILFAALAALDVETHATDGRQIDKFEDLLRGRAAQLGANFRSLMRGEPFTAAPRLLPPGESFAAVIHNLSGYADIPNPGESAAPTIGGELALAPLLRSALGTAVSGLPPYGPASVPEDELRGAELYVCVNSATARRLGLKNGQRARLSATTKAGDAATTRLFVRVAVFEGIMDNVVGLPLGYGHAGFDVFSQGRGVNGLDLFSLTLESKAGGQYCLAAQKLALEGV